MKLTKLTALCTAATVALFSANPAYACDICGGEAEAVATETSGGPALWKVADEDTTIYMFGTVHMLPDDVDWNSGVVNNALASADTLVTEVDMTPANEAAAAQMFQEMGTLPEGTTLRSLMNEEQLKTFEAGLAKIQLPAEVVDGMEPWLASLVMLQITTQASGFTPDKGVETVLEAAVGPEVRREALETIALQVEVFDGLAMDKQLDYLLDFAADPIEGIKMLNTLVDEWAEGDAETVGSIMNEAMEGSPELADRLLYNRNKNWAEWIDARLDTPGTVFMAVGAGHLAGNKSVQDYLKEKGIETTRIQ